MGHSKEVTLNSGPFHIPLDNQVGDINDRLVVIIKNHSNKTLHADVTIDACIPGPTAITLPSSRTLTETTLATFPRTAIPGHSCQVYEVAITFDLRPFIKVISKGEYQVIAGRPAGGKLEISVVAGTGRAQPVVETGLLVGDAVTFVPYGSWVVERKQRHHHHDESSS